MKRNPNLRYVSEKASVFLTERGEYSATCPTFLSRTKQLKLQSCDASEKAERTEEPSALTLKICYYKKSQHVSCVQYVDI